MITVVTLVVATGYAMMLGLTLISQDQSRLVAALDLSDQLQGGRATGWCFVMLCLTSLLCYFSGRINVRWRAAMHNAPS